MTTSDSDAPLPAAFKQPITLRFGDLEPEVARRRQGDESPAAIVRRDLARYYKILADAMRTVWLSDREAEALVIALNYSRFDPAAYRYLWAEIARQVEDDAANPDEPPVLPYDLDGRAFAAKLRSLTPFALLALIDCYEQYLALGGDRDPYASIRWDLLARVGLVSAEDAARRERERTASRKLDIPFVAGRPPAAP